MQQLEASPRKAVIHSISDFQVASRKTWSRKKEREEQGWLHSLGALSLARPQDQRWPSRELVLLEGRGRFRKQIVAQFYALIGIFYVTWGICIWGDHKQIKCANNFKNTLSWPQILPQEALCFPDQMRRGKKEVKDVKDD